MSYHTGNYGIWNELYIFLNAAITSNKMEKLERWKLKNIA